MVKTFGIVDRTLFQFEAAKPWREADGVVEEVADLLVVIAVLKASACSSFDLPDMRVLWEGYRDVTVIEGESEDVVAEFGGEAEEWG